MLIQLIALSDTLKYSADVVDRAEKVSHCSSQRERLHCDIGIHSYIPADDDIQQDQLGQSPEAPLVYSVLRPGRGALRLSVARVPGEFESHDEQRQHYRDKAQGRA